jgi:hypothetical protein
VLGCLSFTDVSCTLTGRTKDLGRSEKQGERRQDDAQRKEGEWQHCGRPSEHSTPGCFPGQRRWVSMKCSLLGRMGGTLISLWPPTDVMQFLAESAPQWLFQKADTGDTAAHVAAATGNARILSISESACPRKETKFNFSIFSLVCTCTISGIHDSWYQLR